MKRVLFARVLPSPRVGIALGVLLGVLLGLSACSDSRSSSAAGEGSADTAGADRDGHTEQGDHAEHDEGASNELSVDPTMLRDLRLTVAPVESRPGSETTPSLGELGVLPERYAEVSSPVAARVVRFIAAPGEVVALGQPLIELQSVELGRLRADGAAAEARLTLARSALERTRGLARDRISSTQEVQQAEAEAATAEAEAGAARGALAALGLREGEGDGAAAAPDRFTLLSPLAGTVLERSAVLGRAVEPGTMLLRVADTSRLALVSHAYERDALRVRLGASARIVAPALPGETLSGTVARVGSEVERGSRTVEVRVELGNPGGRLLPGMSATAWLPLGAADAEVLAVPSAAVQRLSAEWCVFLPREDGHFEVRAIGRGRDLGGEVEVLHGLQLGEKVVVEGAFVLKAQAERERGGGGHHDH